MNTILIEQWGLYKLKNRGWKSPRAEFYKERMPAAGVRNFLGHVIRRLKHATWNKSPIWEIENHPGFQYMLFTSKDQCTSDLWQEYRNLIASVNEIERERRL